ncbi:MAG: murein biosynthesis integral membrane protein MurJ [Anaerovorax sp.]
MSNLNKGRGETLQYDEGSSKLGRTAAQTAMLMAILTLISKFFGFIRELIMANFYGISYVTDAYVMANTIPSILFAGVFTAVGTAYMPVFSKITEEQGSKAGSKFTSEILNILLIVSVIAAIVGLFFSEEIVSIFAPNFPPNTAELTAFFVKVTFSYAFFTSTAAVLESYLQYRGVFLTQIVVGYVLNASIILVFVISAFTSHYYLVFGYLLGYILRAVILLIIAKRRNFEYTPTVRIDESVKKIMIIAIPVFISSSIQQINLFVDKSLASGLPEGSVSALNYGSVLLNLITGLTITILSTILYPKLNQANSLEDYDRFSHIVETGLNLVAMVALPFTLGILVYSKQLVQIVYERGTFDVVATSFTESAFFYYGMGLLFLSLNDLLVRAYYSMHDTKLPMIFAGIGVIINVTLNLILVKFMAHNGLALATSIAYMANTVMLFIGMRKKYPHIAVLRSKRKLLKIAFASVVAVGTSYLVYIFVIMPMAHIVYMRMVQLGLAVAVAGIVYIVLLVLLKVDEIKLVKGIVGK